MITSSLMLIPLSGSLQGWPQAEKPSVLMLLLLMIGIPVAASLIIGVLAGAGALATRGRSVGGLELDQPVWVGDTAVEGAKPKRGELGASEREEKSETGGASVRW